MASPLLLIPLGEPIATHDCQGEIETYRQQRTIEWVSTTLTTTHLAFAVLLGMLLNMNRDEWFVALTFGVLIDADHLFAAPRYISDNGWAALLRPSWDDGSGLPWRSLMHYPVGAFVVVPLAVGWRLMIPLVFWGSHLLLDYLQNLTVAYSAPVEALLFGSICVAITYVKYSRWKEIRSDADFPRFVSEIARGLMASWAGRKASIRQRLGST